MGMTQTAATDQMTEAQATDEALLRYMRKMMRMAPEAHAAVWAKLPDGAKRALMAGEVRADVLRDSHKPTAEGLTELDWPSDGWDVPADQDH